MYENLGEFILFLNDDVEIGENFFEEILKPFADKSVAIVGCEASRKIWGVNGAVLCIRREIFEMIGGFDETYFFMWEDRDLCENVTRRGYNIAISKAKAVHKGGLSTKKSKFYNENYKAGERYFTEKWGNDRRIIGAMTLGNEEGKYLEMVVEDLFERDLIDELIMVLDNPTDRTPEIAKELASRYPITIYQHNFKLFGTAQNQLRKRLIHYGISKNPYGFLTPDADEVFDEDFDRKAIFDLLGKGIGWDFRIAHFWGDFNHVRVDGMWKNQKNIRLFRYLEDWGQDFSPKPIHCGSGPSYAYKNRNLAPYLFKHYGYIRKVDIQKKVDRYAEFDPYGQYENIDWYIKMKEDGNIVKYDKSLYVDTN